jgi:hypothetical protein
MSCFRVKHNGLTLPVSATGEHMNALSQTTSTINRRLQGPHGTYESRCDRIVDLIDACLIEYEASSLPRSR